MKGATYFIATKQSLGVQDILTVTTCFVTNKRLEYGMDLEILIDSFGLGITFVYFWVFSSLGVLDVKYVSKVVGAPEY